MNKRKLKKLAKKKGLPMPLMTKPKFKFKDAGKFSYIKRLTGGQAKIAAKAPPPNKIDAKDFAVLRAEKAKGRGMGLQDEKVQPGKVMKAKRGKFLRSDPTKPISSVKPLGKLGGAGSMKVSKAHSSVLGKISANKLREMVKTGMNPDLKGDPNIKRGSQKTSMEAKSTLDKVNKKNSSEFLKRRKELGAAGKALSATRLGKIALGVGAAGIAATQYLRSKIKKKEDKNKKTLRDFRSQKKPGVPSEKTRTINKALNKLNKKMGGGMMKRAEGGPAEKSETHKMFMKYGKKVPKKMGGGMMQRPMGYKTGVFASKEDRKKAEKNIKQARSKEGLRSFLSSGNKINQPMRKERYMEGRKARHSAFKKKLGRTAAGIASSLNPVTTAARVIGKVMGKESKKRDFQKGDYGDISVKKMGGGMMNKPMGYKSGKSIKVKCKLGRNKPTKMY